MKKANTTTKYFRQGISSRERELSRHLYKHWSDLIWEWSFSSVFEKGKHKQEQVAEGAAGLTEKSLQEIAYVEWEKENRG